MTLGVQEYRYNSLNNNLPFVVVALSELIVILSHCCVAHVLFLRFGLTNNVLNLSAMYRTKSFIFCCRAGMS